MEEAVKRQGHQGHAVNTSPAVPVSPRPELFSGLLETKRLLGFFFCVRLLS